MILRPLQPAETFYRFNTPRWACSPTSGVGASKIGGRFNRPGTDALYLSRRIETAAAEYQQGEPLMPPGTLVTYAVELSSIVDFQEGYSRGEWDELWSDWNCEWRRQALYEGIEPPSWLLADISIERGAKGILFPSTRHAGGCNLVVYTRQLEDADKLTAHDPRGDLPQNQDSWPR
jgi:RES domain-containing protein